MALKKDGKGAVVGQWHQKYMEIDFDSGKAKPFSIQGFDMIYADCEMYCQGVGTLDGLGFLSKKQVFDVGDEDHFRLSPDKKSIVAQREGKVYAARISEQDGIVNKKNFNRVTNVPNLTRKGEAFFLNNKLFCIQ